MINKKIFITGGAGYVGSKLVPKLLDLGHEITVFDLMIYGENVLPKHEKLTKIKGDSSIENYNFNNMKDFSSVRSRITYYF